MISNEGRPFHPGMVLQHIYLSPRKITEQQLAQAIGESQTFIKDLLCGKRSITPDTAFRLAKYFNTTADFWMALQSHVDMYDTLQSNKESYDKIQRMA